MEEKEDDSQLLKLIIQRIDLLHKRLDKLDDFVKEDIKCLLEDIKGKIDDYCQ